MSRQQLEGLGYQIDWHSYPMAHVVNTEEIKNIGDFLKRIL